jgi:asparagine synthase (glutamine-hydrolysing)
MCGLSGLVRFGGKALDEQAQAVLASMTALLGHRGPDDTVLRVNGSAGLGFTRLSLMDPEYGGQPFTTFDGSTTLIANGEVYNHKGLSGLLPAGTVLKTRSDCEVLIHLYEAHGMRFLDMVHGMYAIIIVDRRRNRLILARDRFGIKPLYFHRDNHRIVLSSEIKGLFADPATPRELSWQAALSRPVLGAAPELLAGAPTAWFTGIDYVPAGTIMEIDLGDGNTRSHRYWTFPGPGLEIPDSDEAVIAEYRDLLAASVADCASADAEVGLFLSGGIDSTAVAALARGTTELHTFSVLSASTFINGDAEYAHRVAAKLGLPNHQVLFTPDHTPTTAEWKRLLWLSETPLCGPEVYYKHELHRYAKEARPGVKAMLLGAASDEMNGGYSEDFAGGGGWDDFIANITTMHRRQALGAHPSLLWFEQSVLPLLNDTVLDVWSPGTTTDPYAAYLASEYHKIQQYNVWHEDRTAAGSGVEARVPFLDHRLVELVAAIPAERRARLLWDKRILREAMRGIVPDFVVDRPKGPFFYGDGVQHTHRMLIRMLTQDRHALVEEALASPGAKMFADSDGIRSLLRRVENGHSTDEVELLLRLVNLGLLETMLAELPPPLTTTRTPIVPTTMPIEDWDAAPLEDIVLGARPIDLAMRPALAEGALLLRSATTPDTWYAAMDGSIEFVIDNDNPVWLRFLQESDGTRDVATILDSIGCPLDDIVEPLREALDAGLLDRLPPAPTTASEHH